MALRIAAIPWPDRHRVIVVEMASGASHVGVTQGERKSCLTVIEIRCQPAHGGVAILTVRDGELRAGRGMHGIICLLPGNQVTLGVSAICGGDLQVEVATNVALLARYVGMTQCQWEIYGRRGMINRRTQPCVEACMTKLALIRREFCRCAAMCRGSRVLPILHVAGSAGRRKPQVIPHRSVFMALVAFHHGVRAEERKPVEVLLNRLD